MQWLQKSNCLFLSSAALPSPSLPSSWCTSSRTFPTCPSWPPLRWWLRRRWRWHSEIGYSPPYSGSCHSSCHARSLAPSATQSWTPLGEDEEVVEWGKLVFLLLFLLLLLLFLFNVAILIVIVICCCCCSCCCYYCCLINFVQHFFVAKVGLKFQLCTPHVRDILQVLPRGHPPTPPPPAARTTAPRLHDAGAPAHYSGSAVLTFP